MRTFVAAAAVSGGAVLLAGCGGGGKKLQVCGVEQDEKSGTPSGDKATVPDKATYDAAVKGLTKDDMKTLRDEMATLLTTDNECWPYDKKVGSYAGLMARLTWHCSGSYRDSDKKGGCTGGRQRFEPERSWPDNANLEKARHLLVPMKEKWGDKLSWGDLIVLSGTVGYAKAGADVRMCYGRMDEADGERSKPLGPTANQKYGDLQTVDQNSDKSPGATTVGLIYVNPGGPKGGHEEPMDQDLINSAMEIRATFSVMDHSDRGAVALIGGGHAIGKTHGACEEEKGGKGPIWEGTCRTGKGADTTTSGFEGYWTDPPNKFNNQFFQDLLDQNWTKYQHPGSKAWQWKPTDGETERDIFRLSTDIALLKDAAYKQIVEEFAADEAALKEEFKKAWHILTTRGDGTWSPEAKCDDDSTPPKSQFEMRSDDVAFV